MSKSITVRTRTQVPALDRNNRKIWRTLESEETIPSSDAALLICDVWDGHWCVGAVERLEAMIHRMNETAIAARKRDILVVHAPSDTMDVYADTPARKRAQSVTRVSPSGLEMSDPPLPIDDSDNGSDTGEPAGYEAWSAQHPAIEIDHDHDVISDNGEEIYSVFASRGIETMFILGVHTNMCVLHRSFGIKQMVRWGIRPILIRDLTDTMYNPEMPPYVSHEQGTELVIGYIEKFWCPTILSDDFH